jgi:hypothetical protein
MINQSGCDGVTLLTLVINSAHGEFMLHLRLGVVEVIPVLKQRSSAHFLLGRVGRMAFSSLGLRRIQTAA